MKLLLIGGMSGSGKSVALTALEDFGYYAINNLPAKQVPELAQHLQREHYERIAVALDLKSLGAIAALPTAMRKLRNDGWTVDFLFLDAKNETLVKRFSETRRKHPLSNDERTLHEAIDLERELLAEVRTLGYHFDTSDTLANALRTWIKDFVSVDTSGLTLLFQSFGYKHGIPLDADLVFDVRCLPNPFYEGKLAGLSGRDKAVIDYFKTFPEVERMFQDIHRFVSEWLPSYSQDNRHYLTVAIGCTGGQHRSVYLVERLATIFEHDATVLKRHRELD